MPTPISTFITVALVATTIRAGEEPRALAEARVAEAVAILKSSGLDKLVHEINHNNGRLAKNDASSPPLIVYDIKGKILAYAGDSRHIRMDHSKAVAGLLTHVQSTHKGWYSPQPEIGTMQTAVFFEKVGDALITATIHPR